ncbi:hypothetical protein RC90_19955 [Pectobacterium brasiliense]|uniref:hypothetical protein n=1 Tax=Pectobacterium TaxID=122277 RepID=UPI00057EDECB|nr:hypothetical protein [Pectobacterium brasiliense]KHS63882.1 hypothetical protein RC77_20230 [Pectobacterium brasiliense]KHS67376.1 hypothetical protein RC79_21325 [Pectobacterium brasiliense]KHS93673.1 hypothetical protein RC90_19955 [Pectobacterium brasiliense]
MKGNVFILRSLLKVFDANYVVDSEISLLSGLDVNNKHDLSKACNILLKDEYLSFSDKERREFISTIDYCLEDKNCDFKELLRDLSLVFDNDVLNNREFISNIRDIISSY